MTWTKLKSALVAWWVYYQATRKARTGTKNPYDVGSLTHTSFAYWMTKHHREMLERGEAGR